MRVLLVLLAMTGLAACSYQAPPFEMPKDPPRPGMARLVLYLSGPQVMRSESRVLMNDTLVCYLAPGEVMKREIPPGRHVIAVDTPLTPGMSVLTTTVEAGKTLYISGAPNAKRVAVGLVFGPLGQMVASDSATARGGHYVIEAVSEKEALEGVQEMGASDCLPH
jgi:hypothetical protein